MEIHRYLFDITNITPTFCRNCLRRFALRQAHLSTSPPAPSMQTLARTTSNTNVMRQVRAGFLTPPPTNPGWVAPNNSHPTPSGPPGSSLYEMIDLTSAGYHQSVINVIIIHRCCHNMTISSANIKVIMTKAADSRLQKRSLLLNRVASSSSSSSRSRNSGEMSSYLNGAFHKIAADVTNCLHPLSS